MAEQTVTFPFEIGQRVEFADCRHANRECRVTGLRMVADGIEVRVSVQFPSYSGGGTYCVDELRACAEPKTAVSIVAELAEPCKILSDNEWHIMLALRRLAALIDGKADVRVD